MKFAAIIIIAIFAFSASKYFNLIKIIITKNQIIFSIYRY